MKNGEHYQCTRKLEMVTSAIMLAQKAVVDMTSTPIKKKVSNANANAYNPK
jgi:hypothetical protein